MKWYPWLNIYYKNIVDSYSSNRNHHASLICSTEDLGEDILIYAVRRFLLCLKPERYKSCGTCRSCQLMIHSKMHPDDYIFECDNDKKKIGIDIIRYMKEIVYKSTMLSDVKLIWFKDVVSFTEDATNALLKTIEEPPEKTYFFLSCHNPKKLLSTLRSRCCLYNLKPPNESCITKWLSRQISSSKEDLISALRLCHGSPIAALKLLQSEVWLQRKQLFDTLEIVIIKTQNWFDLMELLNHKYVIQQLYYLLSFLLDIVKLHCGVNLFNNADYSKLIKTLTKFLPILLVYKVLLIIYEEYNQLSASNDSNRELMIVNLLLRIDHIFDKKEK